MKANHGLPLDDSMGTSCHEPRPHSSRLMALVSWLAAMGSLAVLTVLLLYVRGNDTNHTGFEPWLLSICFVPSAIIGAATLLRGRSRWGALLAIGLGLGGMAFLFYIDHFNVMVQYQRWLNRGMP